MGSIEMTRHSMFKFLAPIVLAGGSIATPSPVTVAPVVAIAPGPYLPGQLVTVHGSGFPADALVDIRVDILAKSVRTDATGDFQAGIYLRCKLGPGTVSASVTGPDGMTSAVGLSVLPAAVANNVAAGPIPAIPGHRISVYGCFYTAKRHIAITLTVPLAGGSVRTKVHSTQVGGPGHFGPVRFTVPRLAQPGATGHVTATLVEQNRSVTLPIPIAQAEGKS